MTCRVPWYVRFKGFVWQGLLPFLGKMTPIAGVEKQLSADLAAPGCAPQLFQVCNVWFCYFFLCLSWEFRLIPSHFINRNFPIHLLHLLMDSKKCKHYYKFSEFTYLDIQIYSLYYILLTKIQEIHEIIPSICIFAFSNVHTNKRFIVKHTQEIF